MRARACCRSGAAPSDASSPARCRAPWALSDPDRIRQRIAATRASCSCDLGTRQADRAVLQQRLEDLGAGRERQVVLPSAEELTAIYGSQVARLEELLAGTVELVEANELLRKLLSTVVVCSDASARNGLRVEIRSSAARLFLADR